MFPSFPAIRVPARYIVADTPGDARERYFFQVTCDGLFLALDGVCLRPRDFRPLLLFLLDKIFLPADPFRKTHRPVEGFLISDLLQRVMCLPDHNKNFQMAK